MCVQLARFHIPMNDDGLTAQEGTSVPLICPLPGFSSTCVALEEALRGESGSLLCAVNTTDYMKEWYMIACSRALQDACRYGSVDVLGRQLQCNPWPEVGVCQIPPCTLRTLKLRML